MVSLPKINEKTCLFLRPSLNICFPSFGVSLPPKSAISGAPRGSNEVQNGIKICPGGLPWPKNPWRSGWPLVVRAPSFDWCLFVYAFDSSRRQFHYLRDVSLCSLDALATDSHFRCAASLETDSKSGIECKQLRGGGYY